MSNKLGDGAIDKECFNELVCTMCIVFPLSLPKPTWSPFIWSRVLFLDITIVNEAIPTRKSAQVLFLKKRGHRGAKSCLPSKAPLSAHCKRHSTFNP